MITVTVKGLPASTAAGVVYVLVDPDDFVTMNDYRWRIAANGYVLQTCKPHHLLHRLIMGLPPGDVRQVDHRNRNKLDNRRVNLRLATQAENMQNLAPYRRGHGYRGVSWEKRRQRWYAQTHVGGKHLWLGYHDSPEEAARAVTEFLAANAPFSEEAGRL